MTTDGPIRALAGRHILVVEDERLVAEDVRIRLAEHGAIVVGPASTIAQAMTLIACEGALDAAVLDMNLGGLLAEPVADRLADAGVPYLIVSGYGAGVVDGRHDAVPRVDKPLDVGAIVTALEDLLGRRT